MAVTSSRLEEITTWCDKTPELAEPRDDARRTYFAVDDPRPVRYWSGAGEAVSRHRRFLGWFAFSFRLPDGTQPAERAVKHLYRGAIQAEALQAVRNARYVLAVVNAVVWGRGITLEIEDERFDVPFPAWSRQFSRDRSVVAHLIPVRGPHVCLPGPGWLEWPMQIGPNLWGNLKRLQLDPLAVERLLQSRTTPEEAQRAEEYPQDATLADAVARMTEAAQVEGRTALVMSVEEWAELVVHHMQQDSATAFAAEIVERVGAVDETEDVNRWLGLAMNIWNTTPQPDRGGKTAREIWERGRGPPET